MGNSGYKVNPNIFFWIRLKTLTSNNGISRILEIAYIYTDMKLTTCQMGLHIVLRCSEEQFLTANHHQLQLVKANGLYDACIKSSVQADQAEELIMKDIEFRNIARGQLFAAGKQAHLAKYALMLHMPKLHDFLHYRIFDLSSVQLVIQRFEDHTVDANQDKRENEENDKENEETMEVKKDKTDKRKEKDTRKMDGDMSMSEIIGGVRRVNEEVWQDIHQMQFYLQHALNDQ